jgi:hypothetical protein
MYDGNASMGTSTQRKVLYIASTATSPDHRIAVAPSGRKFKTDISEFILSDQDLEAYLQISPVMFKYKSAILEAQDKGIPESQIEPELGFLADDFYDAGLNHLYQTDSDGVPDYLAYDKLPVYNFIIIKKQQERINQLENLLILLENRLAALES